MATLESYIAENEPRFLEELKEFLRIPSIGALPEYRGEMDRCANYAAGQMRIVGLQRAEVMAT